MMPAWIWWTAAIAMVLDSLFLWSLCKVASDADERAGYE